MGRPKKIKEKDAVEAVANQPAPEPVQAFKDIFNTMCEKKHLGIVDKRGIVCSLDLFTALMGEVVNEYVEICCRESIKIAQLALRRKEIGGIALMRHTHDAVYIQKKDYNSFISNCLGNSLVKLGSTEVEITLVVGEEG